MCVCVWGGELEELLLFIRQIMRIMIMIRIKMAMIMIMMIMSMMI